ncbi:Rieske (2Fe-2S) protein [Aquitalea magnusonii]|uniref:Nitrite reductase/ring-hydroxylating ferredoxin subunit n=1 Tax=Aquitalea magnusonii TaxID=332411 RepID=A0A318JVQ7_9NEIS|nr:Rieske 2Fe-2S domain-containing protein [Aquitalea magnusonii]PXX49070.1 nitrite reductase/ring-hydroxylating ferredoxin subunit [Aquitalea magnusonii]
MAADTARLICASADLQDSGRAVRFTLDGADGKPLSALALRYQGRVYGYINACRHIPIELDLQDGNVFDLSGQYLVCSMHGALYLPNNGRCVGGPCRGHGLQALPLHEADGQVWLNVMPA